MANCPDHSTKITPSIDGSLAAVKLLLPKVERLTFFNYDGTIYGEYFALKGGFHSVEDTTLEKVIIKLQEKLL